MAHDIQLRDNGSGNFDISLASAAAASRNLGVLYAVLAAWQIATPAQPPGRLLVPVEAATPVDNPTFGLRRWLPTVLQSWQPGPMPVIPQRFVVQPGAAAADLPFTRHLEPILASWQIATPNPTIRRLLPPGIPGMSIDNPPPSQDTHITEIRGAWEVLPAPIRKGPLSPGIPGQSIDDPPRQRSQQPLSAPPPDVQPPRRLFPIEEAVVVNDPPFGQRSWLPGIVASWNIPGLLPTLPKVLPQEAAVNDPPFGQRSWLPGVINSWDIPAPLPTLPARTPQETAAAVNDPPFGQRAWLPGVVQAWQPEPRPTLRRLLPPIAPPAGTPIALTNAAAAGMYEVEYYLLVQVAQAATTLTFTLYWADEFGATSEASPALSLASAGDHQLGTMPVYLASGDITYLATPSAALTTGRYAIHVRCTALG
jgi:hypothetical protein